MSHPYQLDIADYYANNRTPIYKGDREASRKLLLDFLEVKRIGANEDYGLQYEVNATMDNLKKYDVLFTNAYLKLFSPKAISILQEICPEQIQVFDTVIECKDGIVDTYKAINILNEVDVSDPERSKFRYLTDNKTIAGYELGCLVIKNQSIEPRHIGREKHSHARIIISATLKEAFEKAKIKGCQYWAGD